MGFRFFILVCAFSIISCKEKYREIYSCLALPDDKNRKDDTLLADSLATYKFSRLYKPRSSGLTCSFKVPVEFNKNSYYVVFSGKSRTNYAHSNAAVCLSSSDISGNQIDWKAAQLRYFYTDINTWCAFKDSIFIKYETWNKPYQYITVFAFLGDSEAERYDLDSLKVHIKASIN